MTEQRKPHTWRKRVRRGLTRKLHLQSTNQSGVVRRTATTLGISQTERTCGVHLLNLPCSRRSRGRQGDHSADPCGSRTQQVAASPQETIQFPIPLPLQSYGNLPES